MSFCIFLFQQSKTIITSKQITVRPVPTCSLLIKITCRAEKNLLRVLLKDSKFLLGFSPHQEPSSHKQTTLYLWWGRAFCCGDALFCFVSLTDIIQLWASLHPCQMRTYLQLLPLLQVWLQFGDLHSWMRYFCAQGRAGKKRMLLTARLFLEMATSRLWPISANIGLSPPKYCISLYLETISKVPFSDLAGTGSLGWQLQPHRYQRSARLWSHQWVYLYTSRPSTQLPVPGMAGQWLSSRKPHVSPPRLTSRAWLLPAS